MATNNGEMPPATNTKAESPAKPTFREVDEADTATRGKFATHDRFDTIRRLASRVGIGGKSKFQAYDEADTAKRGKFETVDKADDMARKASGTGETQKPQPEN